MSLSKNDERIFHYPENCWRRRGRQPAIRQCDVTLLVNSQVFVGGVPALNPLIPYVIKC
jgi:hypothetical protein